MLDDHQINGFWKKSVVVNGKQRHTKSHVKWQSMRTRCIAKNMSYATYDGCSLSDNFNDFQYFTNWHINQVGYDTDYHLDKDLLLVGNKQYNETICVLLPPELNYFIRGSVTRRGKYPQGVSYDKDRQLFKSFVSVGNKTKNLGRFSTIEEAKATYCKAKDILAKQWYDRLMTGEFMVDLRVITAMATWKTEERYYGN